MISSPACSEDEGSTDDDPVSVIVPREDLPDLDSSDDPPEPEPPT